MQPRPAIRPSSVALRCEGYSTATTAGGNAVEAQPGPPTNTSAAVATTAAAVSTSAVSPVCDHNTTDTRRGRRCTPSRMASSGTSAPSITAPAPRSPRSGAKCFERQSVRLAFSAREENRRDRVSTRDRQPLQRSRHRPRQRMFHIDAPKTSGLLRFDLPERRPPPVRPMCRALRSVAGGCPATARPRRRLDRTRRRAGPNVSARGGATASTARMRRRARTGALTDQVLHFLQDRDVHFAVQTMSTRVVVWWANPVTLVPAAQRRRRDA